MCKGRSCRTKTYKLSLKWYYSLEYHFSSWELPSCAAGRCDLSDVPKAQYNVLLAPRGAFARMVAEDATHKDLDPLKEAAREVFDMAAKGRGNEHIQIAVRYLVDRVSEAKIRRCA